MNKVVKRTRKQVFKLWVKALRSGEYKQSEGSLKNKDGFCCLGVLCDLAAKDGGAGWTKEKNAFGNYGYKNDHDVMYGALPNHMREWLKISIEEQDKLVEMNDGRFNWTESCSFSEIANYIENTFIKGATNV